jgi:hypothetical protein
MNNESPLYNEYILIKKNNTGIKIEKKISSSIFHEFKISIRQVYQSGFSREEETILVI